MENQQAQFNILLIEDDDDHAEVMEFYIKEVAGNVTLNRIEDGEKAIQFIRGNEDNFNALPNLILLDLKLPKFDGHEILREIKSSPLLKQIFVIIFTSSNSDKDVETALKNHANSYIVKPVELNGFREIVELIVKYWKSNERIRDKGGSLK